MTTDGFDTWSASRDRHYDRNRVNAPVSRQMVGSADLDEYGAWDTAPEYGAVWYPANVAEDWAPYRNGYWTEVGVWGPTWVDAAPWGYAPFHYGRWVHIRGRWGWCPGGYVAKPVWAPALVGWVGGPGWRVSGGSGAPIYGWVPLGWGEAYHPRWKGCSDGCWARYNKPYAVNPAVRRNTPPERYANSSAPGGLTAVPAPALAGRKPVASNLVARFRRRRGKCAGTGRAFGATGDPARRGHQTRQRSACAGLRLVRASHANAEDGIAGRRNAEPTTDGAGDAGAAVRAHRVRAHGIRADQCFAASDEVRPSVSCPGSKH